VSAFSENSWKSLAISAAHHSLRDFGADSRRNVDTHEHLADHSTIESSLVSLTISRDKLSHCEIYRNRNQKIEAFANAFSFETVTSLGARKELQKKQSPAALIEN
jgi:hypothetical protein